MRITRREFIGVSAAAAGCFSAHSLPLTAQGVPDPYDTLIQGQYANDVQFVRQAGGLYLGDNFVLSSNPFTWTLRLGRYRGKYNGHSLDLHGYWIYKKNANVCWQAVDRGGGDLHYWNQDGHAAGQPEDWELFSVYGVSKADKTVKIFNTSYHKYQEAFTGSYNGSKDPCYVNLTGGQFSCNDSFENAAILVVQFV